MTKAFVIGPFIGGLLSILYSFFTASAHGRNVLTGEPMDLQGIQAIYVFVNENGLASYLVTLLPVFVITTLVSCTVVYFWGRHT
ncbi:hypothetical protein SAMN04487963_1298 [Marinobacter zhejiangensis]|uniref:Uncharacterized protein n=1 Tax=Marinobacter zhejiangensis TaxID=488535 RepID=A0A1I4NCL2_9GAMM|nr:hypothetical protein SAMN04487963_1298 [Marinobacter zhejiangensis]